MAQFTDLLDEYLEAKQFRDTMQQEWTGDPAGFVECHWSTIERLDKAKAALNGFFAEFLHDAGVIDLGA